MERERERERERRNRALSIAPSNRLGSPGPVCVEVSDIPAQETDDIRNNARRREEEILEELRKEALHRQHEEATLNSNWGTQHHLTK